MTRSPYLEKDLEAYFNESIRELGGETRKLKWIGRNAAPDRLVLFYGVDFVELKKEGLKPTRLQNIEHGRMRNLGARVYVFDTKAGIDLYCKQLEKRKHEAETGAKT